MTAQPMLDIFEAPPATAQLLPDVPSYVHGIVNLDPFTIQCDGCGLLKVKPEGRPIGTFIALAGINFDIRRGGRTKRMCADCWKDHP